MATFDFDVDTSPMAQRIDTVSTSVGIVGTAVVAMQSKLVEAEKKAAEDVSNNITYGFYILTKNQFSQKQIEFENEVHGAYFSLTSFQKKLYEIKERMEKDYNTISSRYLKHFTRINDSLKNKVYDLDRPLLRVVIDYKDEMQNRFDYSACSYLGYSNEVTPKTGLLGLNLLKRSSLKVISYLKNMTTNKIMLQKQFGRYLENGSEEKSIYVPVIVYESDDMDVIGRENTNIQLPKFPDARQGQEVFRTVVDSVTENREWVAPEKKDLDLLRNQFINMLTGMDDKKKSLMVKLFDSSPLQVLKKV